MDHCHRWFSKVPITFPPAYYKYGAANQGCNFYRNRRKEDKIVSTHISQFLQGAEGDNPVVRFQDSPFLCHTGSMMAPAYFSSYHLSPSVVISLNCIPIYNLSPPLDQWLSNLVHIRILWKAY